MQSDDEKRSLFAELAARRSRSADLTRRAIEQDVAVVEIPADPQAADCAAAEPTEEAAAFDDVALSDSLVSKDELQEASSKFDPDDQDVLENADDSATNELANVDDAAEESEAAGAANEFADDVGVEGEDSGAVGDSEIVGTTTDAPTETPEAAGEGTPEDAIGQSEPFLGPELEMPEDLDESMEAEKLADQIGQVVDIQRLPKTKPMRVLSKAARGATGNAASPKAPEKTEARDATAEARDSASESRSPAKKKKRATLLDSYFMGL